MLEQYEFEGTIFNVHPSQKEDFLKKYPNAQLKQNELGKTSDPVNVEANAGSNNMASNSENGLSDLQKNNFLLQGTTPVSMPGGGTTFINPSYGIKAMAFIKDPIGVFNNLVNEGGFKSGAAGFADTSIEITLDNLKDTEEMLLKRIR